MHAGVIFVDPEWWWGFRGGLKGAAGDQLNLRHMEDRVNFLWREGQMRADEPGGEFTGLRL